MHSEIQSEKQRAIYSNDSVEIGTNQAHSLGGKLFSDAYSESNHQQAKSSSAFDVRTTYFSAEAHALSNDAAKADRIREHQQLRQDKPQDLKRGVTPGIPTFLDGFEIEFNK